MDMANMNLIGVFVTKLWPVQALACGGGGDGGGGATKNITSPKFSNFGDIIITRSVEVGGGWLELPIYAHSMFM